jgi:hypothetical protein
MADFRRMRDHMVEVQIKRGGIRDEHVLNGMRSLPRAFRCRRHPQIKDAAPRGVGPVRDTDWDRAFVFHVVETRD